MEEKKFPFSQTRYDMKSIDESLWKLKSNIGRQKVVDINDFVILKMFHKFESLETKNKIVLASKQDIF
jgi:hypothetical protein